MKKTIIILLNILTIILLVSCNTNKTIDNVKVSSITLSYDGYEESANDNKTIYYLNRNTDYNINIYLENEENYTISSVIIKDKVFTSEDFDENSTNTKIIINENTSDNYGINEIFVSELRVIVEGSVKEVFLQEPLTIELLVKERYTPNALLITDSKVVGHIDYNAIINVIDRGLSIDFENNGAYLEVFENGIIIRTIPLNIGHNDITIENLKIETKYNYKVVGSYNLYDEEGEQKETMLEGSFTTKAPFNIRVFREEETSFEFEYEELHNVDLKKISLYDGTTKIRDIDFDTKKVSDLAKSKTFDLVFEYEYEIDGEIFTNKQVVEARTITVVWEDVIRDGKIVRHPDGSAIRIPTYQKQEVEVRGIWVSTVDNIDIPQIVNNDVEGYKQYIRNMFDNIKEAKFNTIFFQIRPMNDAFYPSNLAPWSRYITGTEDKNPGFDVLEFAINEAHSRGLELHGWLNPYRVSNSVPGFEAISEKNFAKNNPDLLLSGPGAGDTNATILNPGRIEVQSYIREVIKEIVNNYPSINGIHFDDYFYLTTFGENQFSPDYQTYLEFRTDENQSIADFRRMSVTNMIRDIYNDVTEFNTKNETNIRFGVSPSGVWADKSPTIPDGSETRSYQHYVSLYADTKLWINEGYIHYIIPQIYWDFQQVLAPYAHLIDWWSDVIRGTDVDLIIGMGLYRYAQPTTHWDTYELAQQLRYNQNYTEVKGSTFFTYRDIVRRGDAQARLVLDYIYENYWTDEAVTPWSIK